MPSAVLSKRSASSRSRAIRVWSATIAAHAPGVVSSTRMVLLSMRLLVSWPAAMKAPAISEISSARDGGTDSSRPARSISLMASSPGFASRAAIMRSQ